MTDGSSGACDAGVVPSLAVDHDDLRPLMFSIAYRMLGSVVEAEDVVQEAFLRMHRTVGQGAQLDNPDAYATTVTTRLAIDALRSARMRRVEYVGPWLPEPVVPERVADPAERLELDETVSLAVLTLMEALSPLERAVFILREAFAYDYADIAAVVDRSEAACRQLFARARRHVADGQPRFDASPEDRDALAAAFLTAVDGGGFDDLERLLADDVVFYGDGGGRAPAIREPLRGSTAVARFLLGLLRRGDALGVRLEPAHANGHPALLALGPDDALLAVLSLDVSGGRVTALRNQLNPAKLGHLGTVGDLTSLLRGDDGSAGPGR